MPDQSEFQLDRAVNNLVREMTGWKSLAITVDSAQSRSGGGVFGIGKVPADMKIRRIYLETAAHERFLDQYVEESAGGKPIRMTSYCDGKKCAELRYGDKGNQEHVNITRSFSYEKNFGYSEDPSPLNYYYVGLVPIYELLPEAEQVGRSTVMDRACDRMVFRHVEGSPGKSQDLVYELDREFSIPLAVEAHPVYSKESKPSWRWEATSLVQRDKFHVVNKSEYRNTKTNLVTHHDVVSLEFNKAMSKTAFWPKIGPGVSVSDIVSNRLYTMPSDKKSAARQAHGAEPKTHDAGASLVAIQPQDSSGTYGFALGTFGVSCLVASIAFWWLSRMRAGNAS
jgi:hypothetical protein